MLGPEQHSARSLVKEEKSYIKEAEDQEARVATFESEGKEEWEVKKQVCNGRSNREHNPRLRLSPRSVRYCRTAAK